MSYYLASVHQIYTYKIHSNTELSGMLEGKIKTPNSLYFNDSCFQYQVYLSTDNTPFAFGHLDLQFEGNKNIKINNKIAPLYRYMIPHEQQTYYKRMYKRKAIEMKFSWLTQKVIGDNQYEVVQNSEKEVLNLSQKHLQNIYLKIGLQPAEEVLGSSHLKIYDESCELVYKDKLEVKFPLTDQVFAKINPYFKNLESQKIYLLTLNFDIQNSESRTGEVRFPFKLID